MNKEQSQTSWVKRVTKPTLYIALIIGTWWITTGYCPLRVIQEKRFTYFDLYSCGQKIVIYSFGIPTRTIFKNTPATDFATKHNLNADGEHWVLMHGSEYWFINKSSVFDGTGGRIYMKLAKASLTIDRDVRNNIDVSSQIKELRNYLTELRSSTPDNR